MSAPGPNEHPRQRSLACLALGLLLVLVLSACDPQKRAERGMQRAHAWSASGNYPAAAAELEAALERVPERHDARIELARVLLQLGDTERAQRELERAIAGGAQAADVDELHCQILLAGRHYDATIAYLGAERLLDPSRRWTLLAAAYAGLGKYDAAKAALSQAFAIAPNDARGLLEAARLETAQGGYDAALKLADDALRTDPSLARAHSLRGRLLMQRREYQNATLAFDQARTTGVGQLTVPEEMQVLIGLTEAHMGAHDIKGATRALAPLAARFPQAPPTLYLRARLAFLNGDYRSAIEDLQRASNDAPEFLPARLMLGAALLNQGSLEQAQAELSQLLAQHPENLEARKLLAQVYLSRRHPADARRLLDEAGEQADPQLDWLMGTALLQTGNIEAGLARLDARALASLSAADRVSLAGVLLAHGHGDRARELLEQIPAEARNEAAQRLLYLASIAGKGPAAARQQLDQLLAKHGDDAVLLATAGNYALLDGDLKLARQRLSRSLEIDPRNTFARQSMAQLEVRVGDLAAAEQQLRAALDIDPRHERTYLQLAGLMALQGKQAEARQWLERALTADPAAVEARLRLAQLAFADGDSKRARLLLEQALKVADDGAVLNAIGEVLMYSGNFDEALDRFDEAAQAGSQVALLNIARAQLALGRSDAARQALESPQIGPELRMPASIMRVQIIARQGRGAEALNAIMELRKQGLPEGAAAELAGDVNMTLRHFDAAVRAYEAAWRPAPNRTLALKLFQARQLAGVEDPARSLREWLDRSGGDRRARYVLAEHYRLTGQRAEAIRQYELLAQQVAKSEPMILNNLAWLYYETGDQRAVGVALKAYDAAPDVPEIADTYGWVLVEQGRTTDGLAVLEQAARGAPENPEIRYHLAAAYARAGNRERAVDVLARLLKSEGSFPGRDGAEHLLRTLAAQ